MGRDGEGWGWGECAGWGGMGRDGGGVSVRDGEGWGWGECVAWGWVGSFKYECRVAHVQLGVWHRIRLCRLSSSAEGA